MTKEYSFLSPDNAELKCNVLTNNDLNTYEIAYFLCGTKYVSCVALWLDLG